MQFILYLLMAIIAGVLVPVQSALNAQLGNGVKSSAYAALLSFTVGVIGMTVYCLVAKVDFTQIKAGFQLPWYSWIGGLMGAFFVLTLIVAPPKLGMALTLGITVAAQLIFGLLMDQFGWFGVPKFSINWVKVIGVGLIIGGVVLLRN
ncbi:MAG: DMT family transporter [Bacteroidota bacterium]